jgi:hypothetical protein
MKTLPSRLPRHSARAAGPRRRVAPSRYETLEKNPGALLTSSHAGAMHTFAHISLSGSTLPNIHPNCA